MFSNREYIYCVYKERSFSKAAEKLHISQPSLSAAVQKVEKKVGAPIFNRNTRPLSLTPFGVEFIKNIERVQEMEEDLYLLAYDLHTLQSGRVSIGGSNLGIPFLVPRRIAAFKQAYPNINVQVLEASTNECKSMLDEGILDLVVTNRPLNTAEYEKDLCYRENLVIALPDNFPIRDSLKSKKLTANELGENIFSVPPEKDVTLAEFGDIPYILLSSSNYLRLCCDMMFQECHISPNIFLEVQSSSAAYNFSSLGLGATIISNILVDSLQQESNLSFYKLNSAYAVRDTYICYRKTKYLSAAVKQMLHFLIGENAHSVDSQVSYI